MSPTDLLRSLLSQVVFNQMKADGVQIDPQIRRGHQLHHALESLSDERERDAFYFYLDQEDRECLMEYREWLEDEDDRGPRLVSKVEGMLEKFVSHQGNISPKTILFKLLGFDTPGLSLEPYDQFSNIHKLLACLAKMSDEISSNETFDLDFFKLLDKYKLAFGFLRECIVQRKFVITQQQHSRLADFLSGHRIDLDEFFSNGGILIPGSPKFDEIFVRAMIESSDLSTITEFDEWSGRYIPLSEEWWIQLFRCWTIIHKRLSSEEQPPQELLTFLKEVSPHLKQTKNFVYERELSDAMYGVLVELYRKLNKGSEAEIPQDLDELLDFMIGQIEEFGSQAMAEYDIHISRCLSRAYLSGSLEKVHSDNLKSEIPEDQKEGLHLRKSSNRLRGVSSSLWSRMMMALPEEKIILFKDSEALFLSLHSHVKWDFYPIYQDNRAMFFQICEEVGIPAELLDFENLGKSLSNVFLYIISLSDELRLADPKSPEFLEFLKYYKRIADAFCNLQLDRFAMFLFNSSEELQRFFQSMDEKLQESGKAALSEHTFSSITSLLISTDFVTGGFYTPLPYSIDFLRLIISTIMENYASCVGEWSVDNQAVNSLVENLCEIFDELGNHELRHRQGMMLNVLCKILPWKEFTDFLQSIRDQHPVEHQFISLTLRGIAENVRKDGSEGMDELYARVLSNYPSGGFVVDRAQISNFVCDQLSITLEFGQVE